MPSREDASVGLDVRRFGVDAEVGEVGDEVFDFEDRGRLGLGLCGLRRGVGRGWSGFCGGLTSGEVFVLVVLEGLDTRVEEPGLGGMAEQSQMCRSCFESREVARSGQ